jgi:hypothetical protein
MVNVIAHQVLIRVPLFARKWGRAVLSFAISAAPMTQSIRAPAAKTKDQGPRVRRPDYFFFFFFFLWSA